MITLTAEIEIKGENPRPFVIGESRIGYSLFGNSVNVVEKIDKRNMISSESEIRERADVDKPSFGLISSGGRISFRDNNSRFFAYASNGILKGNEPVKIFLCNTLSKKREQVGEYFATDWHYDNNSHSVDLYFSDNLEYLQEKDFYDINISVDKYPRDFNNYIYSRIKSYASSLGFSFDNSSSDMDVFLRKIISTTFYTKKEVLWAEYNKVCNFVGANVFCGKNGKIFTNLSLNWS